VFKKMENWLWIVIGLAVGFLVLGVGIGITGMATGTGSSSYCYDSDGINANIPGLIKYKVWIFPETTKADLCTLDKKAVNERYCNNVNAASKIISCAKGCIVKSGTAFSKSITSGVCAP
jgi:hypothetical protein